jgi:membrane peptidoglycan carboxypeptidase
MLGLGIIAIAVFVPLAVVGAQVAAVYSQALDRLPQPRDTISTGAIIGPTEIYDSQRQTLLVSVQDPLGDQRAWITLDELPDYVIDATILWEDPDFLEATSFNPIDALDKLAANALRGPLAADSSLTGRLVRNVILPEMDVITAELRGQEIALVTEINRRYSPEEVLEWHLNTNYYGSGAYGIDAASVVYLGKSAHDLTLDEAALLVAIATAPRFNPVDDESAARSRQSDLLRQLLANGKISLGQYEQVANVFTEIRPDAGQTQLVAPEFALYARRQAEEILNALGYNGSEMISRGGLRITTTLDLDLYYQAECVLRAHLAQIAGADGSAVRALDGGDCISAAYLAPTAIIGDGAPDSGTLAIIDAENGALLALVGPADRAVYQPGPTLHPFVYLAGLLNGDPNYTAASMLLDIPRPFPGAAEGLIYPPQNPDGVFRGPLSLRDAMGAGLLPPAAQIANTLGLNTILRNFAFQLGVTSLTDPTYDLSLLERGGAVSVLEMAEAYSVFAALGDVYDLRRLVPAGSRSVNRGAIAVRQISDDAGNVLWEYDSEAAAISRFTLLQEEAAYVVNHILADSGTRRSTLGQNHVLEIPRPTALVNGLTSDRLDNWTIGYSPYFVTAVHLGREAGTPTALSGFGIEGAAPVFRAIMDYAHIRDALPNQGWERPEDVADALVCEISGLRPNDVCRTRAEIFISISQVQALPVDTYWQMVEINSDNGRRATINTPDVLRRQQAYFIPPAEALDWWQLANLPLPPTEFDTSSRPDVLTTAQILRPENFSVIGGIVEVRGSMDSNSMDFYQIAYGQGGNPTQWFNLTDQETTYTPGTVLVNWDTTGLDGTYTLRLLVTNTDRTTDQAFVQIIVDNIAPTLILTAGEPGQVFSFPQEQVIPLEANVRDNYRIDKVEFYHNGLYVGEDQTAPFGYEHRITRTGIEEFRAVAYDSVGNATTSTITVEVRRSSG